MLTIEIILFTWAFWALLFWGSIKLFDPHNAHNTLGKAIAWSALHLIVVFAKSTMPLMGIFMSAAWLVFMLRLLTSFYEMGLLRAMLVVGAIGAGPYVILPLLVDAVGYEQSIDSLVFYGLPLGVFGVWLAPMLRARHERKHADPPIPEARVEKVAAPAAPVRVSSPVVARSSGPVATRPSVPVLVESSAPIVIEPSRPSAPIVPTVAPSGPRPAVTRAPTDSSAGDEPSFLR